MVIMMLDGRLHSMGCAVVVVMVGFLYATRCYLRISFDKAHFCFRLTDPEASGSVTFSIYIYILELRQHIILLRPLQSFSHCYPPTWAESLLCPPRSLSSRVCKERINYYQTLFSDSAIYFICLVHETS